MNPVKSLVDTDRFFLGEVDLPYYRSTSKIGTAIPDEHKSNIEARWRLNGTDIPCRVIIPNHSYRCAMVEFEKDGETLTRVAFISDLRAR